MLRLGAGSLGKGTAAEASNIGVDVEGPAEPARDLDDLSDGFLYDDLRNDRGRDERLCFGCSRRRRIRRRMDDPLGRVSDERSGLEVRIDLPHAQDLDDLEWTIQFEPVLGRDRKRRTHPKLPLGVAVSDRQAARGQAWTSERAEIRDADCNVEGHDLSALCIPKNLPEFHGLSPADGLAL